MLIFKKEKRVAKLIQSHVDKIDECLRKSIEVMIHYLDGNQFEAENSNRTVNDLETEADTIRYEILDKLYAGAFLPMIREDIVKLVVNMDGIANAVERCSDFFVTQKPEIPEDQKPRWNELVHASWKTFDPLRDAMRLYFKPKGKVDEVRSLAKQVGMQESVVDQIEASLTTKIFSSSLDLSRKMHLQQGLYCIVLISDRAEDCTDQLELTCLKSVV